MKLSPIDLNLLVALDAVLAEASLGRAATRLGISRPAMSHAMARLRAQTGDPILVRSGQKWTLSQRAQALAPRVQTLVADALSALSPGAIATNLDREREFRIHTTDQVLALFGIALGRAVAKEAPRASLRFFPLQDEEASALREDVDLAIGKFQELPVDLRQQRLFRDGYACIVRKGHPLVKGKLTMSTFLALDHVLCAPGGRTSGIVDAALRKRRLRRRVVRVLPFLAATLELISESDGIATISARLARKEATRYGLACFDPPLALPPCIVAQLWHPRVDADPGHAWLRKLIYRVAAQTSQGT